jgi:hypothetical protein
MGGGGSGSDCRKGLFLRWHSMGEQKRHWCHFHGRLRGLYRKRWKETNRPTRCAEMS